MDMICTLTIIFTSSVIQLDRKTFQLDRIAKGARNRWKIGTVYQSTPSFRNRTVVDPLKVNVLKFR